MRGGHPAFYAPWNNIQAFYRISGAGGDSSRTWLFDNSFFGPELPYFAHLPYPWQGCGYYVNFDDLISQRNLTDCNVEIQWRLMLNDIVATVNPKGQNFHLAYLGSLDKTLLDINVTVRQGVPEQIQYNNSSISTTQSIGLTRSNVTIDSPIDLYNPTLLSLKQSISYLAGVSLCLIIAQAVILYVKRPRTVAARNQEPSIENR